MKGDNKKGEKEITCKVYLNKYSNQKLITIPKHCEIKVGDYVKVSKMRLIKE